MKIYISGPVRGKVDYAEDFFESEKMLKHCDTIYLLPGWRDSCGCNREYGYALAAGMTIIDVEQEVKDE